MTEQVHEWTRTVKSQNMKNLLILYKSQVSDLFSVWTIRNIMHIEIATIAWWQVANKNAETYRIVSHKNMNHTEQPITYHKNRQQK